MNCSQFKSNIFTFSEGTIPEELRHSSNQHLASCAECTRLLSSFNAIEAIIKQEKAEEPNLFTSTRILQRLEKEFEQGKARHTTTWIRVLQPLSIALALVCGLFIGLYTAKKDHTPASQIAKTSENIEFLRSNLFIAEFADEDKILIINK